MEKSLSVAKFAKQQGLSTQRIYQLIRDYEKTGTFIEGWRPAKVNGQRRINPIEYGDPEDDGEPDFAPDDFPDDELQYYANLQANFSERVELMKAIDQSTAEIADLWFKLACNYQRSKLFSKYRNGQVLPTDYLYGYTPSWRQAVIHDAHLGWDKALSSPPVPKAPVRLPDAFFEAICRAYLFSANNNTATEIKITITPSAEYSVELISPPEPWLQADLSGESELRKLLDCWLNELLSGYFEGQRTAQDYTHLDKCLWCLKKLSAAQRKKRSKTCGDRCGARLATMFDAALPEFKDQERQLGINQPLTADPQIRLIQALRTIERIRKARCAIAEANNPNQRVAAWQAYAVLMMDLKLHEEEAEAQKQIEAIKARFKIEWGSN